MTDTSNAPGPRIHETSKAPWRAASDSAAGRPPSSDANAAASAAVCARVRSSVVRPMVVSATRSATSSTAATDTTRTAACPRSRSPRPDALAGGFDNLRDGALGWFDMFDSLSSARPVGNAQLFRRGSQRCRVNRTRLKRAQSAQSIGDYSSSVARIGATEPTLSPSSMFMILTPVASRPCSEISLTAIRMVIPLLETATISSSSPTMKASTT